MKAVILAAGKGTRLQPFTNTKPKPLLELLGETVLERLVKSLANNGIGEFCVVTHYKEEQVKEHIKKLQIPLQIKINFIHQTELNGTADAFLRVREWIDKDKFFLGFNGDCLFSPNLVKKAVEIGKKGSIGLGGKLVTNTHHYGIIRLDEDKPVEIIEKPAKGRFNEGYANIGIYVLPKDIFDVLEDMNKSSALSKRGEYEFPDAINSLLEKQKYNAELIALRENDYWYDIGLPWALLEANQTLLSQIENNRQGKIEPNVHIEGNVIIKEGAIIRSGAYIQGPAFIDEGADIGPNCYIRKYTYLGKNTRIGNACEVKNSIIYDGTHAGHLSYIGDSIIGSNSNFGAGTITANLKLNNHNIKVVIKEKVVDSGRRKLGAMIGEGVKTGIGTLIMPGVKIGHHAWIGAGTIVNQDVEEETIHYVTQKYNKKRKKSNAN